MAYKLCYIVTYSSLVSLPYDMKEIPESRAALRSLGDRLRRSRLARNDTMAIFAQRLGVSEQTVRAMERGQPTVQVGIWLDALWVLDDLQAVEKLLESRESLIELARREHTSTPRQRASRRRG
ncbi:MAG: helix-turn-helix domain-containing protein [Steroidobacteraceae bacterium]